MRRFTRLGVLMLTGFLMAMPGAKAGAEEAMSHTHTGMPGTPPMGMWDAKSLQKDLGLTDDQVTKLNAARDEQRSVMESVMAKNKELMTQLDGQVKAKASDADITITLNDIDTNRKTAIDEGDKFRTEKDALLSPTQRAKMMLLMMNPMRRGMMHKNASH